jgi:hypothetical protein
MQGRPSRRAHDAPQPSPPDTSVAGSLLPDTLTAARGKQPWTCSRTNDNCCDVTRSATQTPAAVGSADVATHTQWPRRATYPAQTRGGRPWWRRSPAQAQSAPFQQCRSVHRGQLGAASQFAVLAGSAFRPWTRGTCTATHTRRRLPAPKWRCSMVACAHRRSQRTACGWAKNYQHTDGSLEFCALGRLHRYGCRNRCAVRLSVCPTACIGSGGGLLRTVQWAAGARPQPRPVPSGPC